MAWSKEFKTTPCFKTECFDRPDDMDMPPNSIHYHAADPADDDFIVKVAEGDI